MVTSTPLYVFGDSYTLPFQLVDSPYIQRHTFRGIAAKGLGKPGNASAQAICERLRKCNGHALFWFGNVDVHLSVYHVLHKQGLSIDLPMFVQSCVHDYVTFVANLPCKQKYIVCPLASPLSPKLVPCSLIKFHALTQEQYNAYGPQEWAPYFSNAFRARLLDMFIKAIHHAASKFDSIQVINLNPQVTTTQGLLRRKYAIPDDVQSCDFHPKWERSNELFVSLIERLVIPHLNKGSDALFASYAKRRRTLQKTRRAPRHPHQ